MKLKHLDHLNMSVNSFDESSNWYQRVFGFEVVEQGIYRERPWGVLKSGDAMLCIYEDPSRKIANGDDLRSKGLHGINHFALRIGDGGNSAGSHDRRFRDSRDSREEWEEIIKREKIHVDYGGAFRWPHSTSWYISDPTGYTIEVVLWDGDTAQF